MIAERNSCGPENQKLNCRPKNCFDPLRIFCGYNIIGIRKYIGICSLSISDFLLWGLV